MGINWSAGSGTSAYADFVVVAHTFPRKGQAYYYHVTGQPWQIIWADSGFENTLFVNSGVSDGSDFPSTFTTDFPDAIALANPQTTTQWAVH